MIAIWVILAVACPGAFRNVQPRNGYQVNCPVTSPDAMDLAVKLTHRALDKVRVEPRDGADAST